LQPGGQGRAGAATELRRPRKGRGRGLQFTEPNPLDFNDHEGYLSIFDGKTVDGWDGNPKFWRVDDGAMVAEYARQDSISRRAPSRTRACPRSTANGDPSGDGVRTALLSVDD
jgi:hypothetical protein